MVMNRRFKMGRWMMVLMFAALAAMVLRGGRFLDRGTQAASTGTSSLITIQGSGAGTSLGDYISAVVSILPITISSKYRLAWAN